MAPQWVLNICWFYLFVVLSFKGWFKGKSKEPVFDKNLKIIKQDFEGYDILFHLWMRNDTLMRLPFLFRYKYTSYNSFLKRKTIYKKVVGINTESQPVLQQITKELLKLGYSLHLTVTN
jgi:hypothetical protein